MSNCIVQAAGGVCFSTEAAMLVQIASGEIIMAKVIYATFDLLLPLGPPSPSQAEVRYLGTVCHLGSCYC
ncbi:hypothetical protein [Rhizobium sp. LCM 4573]|uniref:hypothetical protein n=1 Tax=Rhizobium sp. LCM 4573 TaxID=1848291 RepID=UPI001041F8E6|nr:hypothetical protein [Rhizobium sp. LCM 4573]